MAEILYQDGRTETTPFPQAPSGEMGIRAPTRFEQYRTGRQRAIETPLKAIGVQPGAAESAGEFLTPQTPAEQGIEIGTLAMPGAGKLASSMLGRPASTLATRGVRYALPAVGGAAGSLLSKPTEVGQALYEGGRGALYGLAGDLLPGAVGLARHPAAVRKADEAAVGRAVESAVPQFGKVSTKQDLDAIGVRSRGTAALDEFRASMLDDLSTKLRGSRMPNPVTTLERLEELGRAKTSREIQLEMQTQGRAGYWPRRGQGGPEGSESLDIPSLAKLSGGGSMSLKQAVGWLANLGDRGWLLTNQLATGLDAKAARALREQARTEIVEQLNRADKGLGDAFDQGMNALAKGHLYIQILQQPGIVADGKLDMNALRDTMGKMATQKQTFGQRLEQLGSAEDVKLFYDALTRGSGDLTARDVPGKMLKIGSHMSTSGRPHFWIGPPSLPKHVGQTPPIRIGPGGTPLSLFAESLTRESPEP